MALGDFNKGNNNGKERFQPTVYCPMIFKNPDVSLDPSELSFSYWKNMLKITISPKIQNEGAQYATYDHTNQGTVYLNHDKARILFNEIMEFLASPDEFISRGVNSGTNSLITISNGKDFGIDNPIIVIRKIDPENGSIISSYMYQFKTQFHKSIRNFDETTTKFDTKYYSNIEIEDFADILRTYYESMTYAMAYSVINNTQYNDSRMNTKLDLMMDKLGIPKVTKGSGATGTTKSYFDMSKEGSKASESDGVKSEQTTIDQLSKMIG